MGKKAVDTIVNDKLTDQIAQRIVLDVISERYFDIANYTTDLETSGVSGVTGANSPFRVGDRLTFSVTYKPSSANKQFIEQVYRCIIEINNGTKPVAEAYHIGKSTDALYVASKASYISAYADTTGYTLDSDANLINSIQIKNV